VPVVKLLTPLLQFMADAVGEFAKWIGTINWGAVGNAIGGAFSDAWDAVFEFFSGLIEWFSKLPDVIGEFLASLPGKWVDGLGKMFDAALFVIGMGIGLLIASITEFPGMVIDALFALPGMLISFLTGMWTTAETTTTSFLDRMVDAIIALPGRWIAGLSLLLPIVGKFFSDAFNHGKEIVFKAINDIVAFVKSIPTRIGDFALNIGVSIVNFFKSFLNRAIDGLNSGIAKVDEIIPGSLPRIPRLAHGGIAMGPALIGEDSRTTPEAAIPLGDARAMAMLRQGLGSGGSVTFQPGSITVNIAGTTTPEQAKKIGENVGAGIANVLSQNNIRTAVRTV